MADNKVVEVPPTTVNLPELTPPAQSGVDHPQHIAETRQVVAENAGVSVRAVTPQQEVADSIIQANEADFMQNVAGVKKAPDQVSEPTNTDPEELHNLGETVSSFIPWDDDNSTVRTGPSKQVFDLKSARKEKMNPPKEAA